MMILGGYGNNRGVLVGAFLITLLDRGSLIGGIYLQPYLPNATLVEYGRYMIEAAILLLLLAFRQKGMFPETRVKTKAYTLFDFGKSSASKEPAKTDDQGGNGT
jgi:ABC-type branched-subunit amino acid transport system permease subunit